MDWWVSRFAEEGRYVELLSWIFWVLLSITLHELAHGWAAIWQGDDTPIRLHRMTLNPVVHMGGHALIMFALCGITWGQLPVNRHRFRDGHRGDIYVSAAGPAMNLLIGFVCLVGLTAWLRLVPEGSNLYRNGAVFLYFGLALNLILASFNLLPIPPLDGSHILAGLSPRARELFQRPQAQMFGLLVFIAVFFMSPIGGLFFDLAWNTTERLIDAAGRMLDNPGIWQVMSGSRTD